MKNIKLLLTPLLVLFFLGCESKTDSGIGKIHWDRDMCARCVMVVSDRQNTVQLTDPKTNKLFVFDDIGCMAVWMSENNPSYKNSVKVWVTDVESGKFINARTALYTTNNITPMSFGFSAHESKNNIEATQESISYEEVLKRAVEKTSVKKDVSKSAMKCGGDMKCGAGKCGK